MIVIVASQLSRPACDVSDRSQQFIEIPYFRKRQTEVRQTLMR
jgi:hypothetical protein